jgi:hypothetical protein
LTHQGAVIEAVPNVVSSKTAKRVAVG